MPIENAAKIVCKGLKHPIKFQVLPKFHIALAPVSLMYNHKATTIYVDVKTHDFRGNNNHPKRKHGSKRLRPIPDEVSES
jgi:hypothetical protein